MQQSMLQGSGTDYKKHFLKYFEHFWESQTSLLIERSLTTPQVLAGGQGRRAERGGCGNPFFTAQGDLSPTWGGNRGSGPPRVPGRI